MAKPTAGERAELIAEAAKLGLVIEGKTDKQIAAAVKQAKEGGEDHAPAGDKSKAPKAPKGHSVANVIGSDGEVIRSYTEEVHGDDFFKNAHEFAGKVEGRSVESE